MAKSKLIVIGCLITGTLMLSAAPVLARDRHHHDGHRLSHSRHAAQDYLLRKRYTMPDRHEYYGARNYYSGRRDRRHDQRDAWRDLRSNHHYNRR